MEVLTTRPTLPAVGYDTIEVGEDRPSKPVKAWATLGAGFVVFIVYLMVRWILSGDASPTPDGPDAIPRWMSIVAQTWQALGLVAWCTFIYFFLVRPWRREGHITLDGMFCIAFQSMYWQDTFANYFTHFTTYNTVFVNAGGWNRGIPGWMSPNANRIAEPLLWNVPLYVYVIFGTVVFANWLMRKAKERRPQLTRGQLLGGIFLFFVVWDLTVEPLFLRLGFYTYPSTIQALTINAGEYYQLPVYQAFLWPLALTAWAALRFYVDDKGRTIVQRGVDDLRTTSNRAKSVISTLALVGFCNLAMLVCYNIPTAFLTMYSGPWPKAVQERSYLNDGICGEGTDHICPGPAIPVTRPGTVHLDPRGELVVPDGVTLPGADPCPESDAAAPECGDDPG